MGEYLIKPYEISVWEDALVQDGNIRRFVEKKLAVIGSDTMTGFNKIYNPVFNKKANGEKSLTFSLKYKYEDPYIGQKVENPFVKFLVNERKIKLHYDNEWYEFVIKDHSESSEDYEWTYTCNDAFVQELSKRGYNITFDSELNNNQGSALELAQKTIQDTEWRLGEVDLLRQLIAEPLYRGVVSNSFQALNVDTNNTETLTSGTNVYVFYSYIQNKDGKFVQFFKAVNPPENLDSKNVITATNYRIVADSIITETAIQNQNRTTLISLNNNNWKGIESQYQGNRVVYNQLTTYDPVMQRTVDIFHAGDREIYRYIDYTYTTSNVITNFFTNGENFNSLEDGTLQGWNPYVDFTGSQGDIIDKLELVLRPELGQGKPLADLSKISQIEGFLKAKFKGAKTVQNGRIKNLIFNSGFRDNVSRVESVSKGDKFVLRFRAAQAGSGGFPNLASTNKIRALVAKYTQDEPTSHGYYYKHVNSSDVIFDFNVETPEECNNYIEGGELISDGHGKLNYVIDDIVQEPSTKYIYKAKNESNREYVWSGDQGTFIPKDNTNYLPYYYLIATAQKAVSKKMLTDSTEKYGIFIYSTLNSDYTYYIQDIQLTRYVEDANGNPLLIGNIPVATSTSTDYYYLKPADGVTEEEVVTYTDLHDLEDEINLPRDSVVPSYNTNSEKRLTISASQSNCFNILQTIAETFECWINIDVKHDDAGYILYDEEGLPEKYINLKEYAGSSNHAGFKYGINLKSIERTVNSEEFVTKLIVEQTQSEYVDEGYVSIASAPSNPSGESYILNFDYYYNQGLLNRNIVEADKLLTSEELVRYNGNIKRVEKERRDLEAAFIALESERNTFTELVETAKENKSEALADFEELTNMSYDSYQEKQSDAIKYQDRDYVITADTTVKDDKFYYYKNQSDAMILIENPNKSLNPSSEGWYEVLIDLSEEDTIYDIIGELYTDSAIINNYSGILTNIEQQYWDKRKELNGSENYNFRVWVEKDYNNKRHLRLELNDYLVGFSFYVNGVQYSSTVSQKNFDIEISGSGNIGLTNFTAPNGYTIKNSDGDVITSYTITSDKVNPVFRIVCSTTVPSKQDEIDALIKQKQDIINSFENKYSHFIQEGTWSSTDYIDPELYYLYAMNVSTTSAFPVVSYTINVVEISEIDGFEWYLFDAGQKTYVEDTEFFGWTKKNNVRTPAREDVFVSEVEWHLDSPEENIITVQNYKTRFEDFFQRIDATVQTVQYNEVSYAKINSLLDPTNSSINKDVMLKSLNSIGGMSYTLTSNGSIVIIEDSILIRNLQNPTNLVKINSEGIRISSDGGVTWATAISGQGIDVGAVFTGTLNTNEIIIGNKDNPSFRWDKAGISAFKFDGSNEETPYDLQTFVRFDQYGLYGIKNNGKFKAEDLDDIKDNAHFAVTWDGFFIKNSYPGGGRVSLTSDNDFQITKTLNNQEKEVIKIGALEWGNGITSPTAQGASRQPSLYGIRITNDNGVETFKTGTDGNIEITGVINALGGNFANVVNVGQENQDHIVIDGRNIGRAPLIKSSNYDDLAGAGWMINKDGDATFNNITARGAIKTAVFEYAEIQAVGGIFIFRPSSVIKSARISGNDLIVKVEKPLLFARVVYSLTNDTSVQSGKTYYVKSNYGYTEVEDPASNPKTAGYYECNTQLHNSWCKISNYTSDGSSPGVDVRNILLTNGLTHVYRISSVNLSTSEVTLEDGKDFVDAVKQTGETDDTVLTALKGGALIDMGRKDGSSNYGIGVNSSDNTVNLPARAISLFETAIDETQNPKVSYNLRGILGTLPYLQDSGATPQVNTLYNDHMADTQGIYTDNMYIGDKTQYIMFYTDRTTGDKHLKISARDIIFGYDEGGHEVGVKDYIDDKVEEVADSNIMIKIESSNGEIFTNGTISTVLTCKVYEGTTDITSSINQFKWTKTVDGGQPTEIITATNTLTITTSAGENVSKEVIKCTVTV